MLECFALLGPVLDGTPPPYPLDEILDRAEELVGVAPGRVAEVLLALQGKGYLRATPQTSSETTCVFSVTDSGRRVLGFET